MWKPVAHLVAISTDNHSGHAWQALVATYSCLQRQRVTPLLVVHDAEDRPLHPFYREAERAGAWLVRTPSYAGAGDRRWAARNTPAALWWAGRCATVAGAAFVVLMDPDLVWTRRVSWPAELAADRTVLRELERPRALAVAAARGVELPAQAARQLGARVPYVVPTGLCAPLARAWWGAMDAYQELPGWEWADQMVAFGIALAELGEIPRLTRFTQTNWRYQDPVEVAMVHYAYGTPYFNKRWFRSEADPDWPDLWTPPPLPVTSVQGWVHREIRQARAFFDHMDQSREVACASS